MEQSASSSARGVGVGIGLLSAIYFALAFASVLQLYFIRIAIHNLAANGYDLGARAWVDQGILAFKTVLMAFAGVALASQRERGSVIFALIALCFYWPLSVVLMHVVDATLVHGPVVLLGGWTIWNWIDLAVWAGIVGYLLMSSTVADRYGIRFRDWLFAMSGSIGHRSRDEHTRSDDLFE